MHPVRFYLRSLAVHLRAALEYEADFWILVGAAVLTQLVGLVFVATVFRRVPQVNGWSMWEVLFVFAMLILAQGTGELLAEGCWAIAGLVSTGELDRMLVRPYPVVLQICSSRFGMNALGNRAVGGSLGGVALAHLPVRWTPAHVVLSLLVFASAMLVKVALVVAANATSFWSASPNNTFAIGMDHLGNLTRYPLSIYWSGLRALLSTAVPFAFVGFFPASFVLGHGGLAWLGLLTPVAAGYSVALTLLVFRLGLRRYESTGH